MGLYEGIKDAAKIVQQLDNIDLYRKLIDLSAQALEMQNEISRLTNEIRELKKIKDLSDRIIRHEQPFLTLQDENPSICYCSRCWDADNKLVQVHCNIYDGRFECPNCDNIGTYDLHLYETKLAKDKSSLDNIIKRDEYSIF